MNRVNKEKSLFVTVGSTKFEDLINTILTIEVLNVLKSQNFTNLTLQIGNGVHDDVIPSLTGKESVEFTVNDVKVKCYRYKSSIKEDMTGADLVISHAGSGSVMESLEAGKKLIVVVNEGLMDNHQLELAEKMYNEGYLLYTNCKGLVDKINLIINGFVLEKYVPGDSKLFGRYLNKLF